MPFASWSVSPTRPSFLRVSPFLYPGPTPIGASERVAVAVLCSVRAPDSGGAQAGGVSPPFTVCAHSWFEVWGGRVAAAVLFAV